MSSRRQMFPNASEERSKRLRIGDAAKQLGLEPYVLRFWEAEFPQLAPLRTKKGQRLYSEQDLELIRTIQVLLYEEGLTIEGAKRRLEDTAQFRKMTRGITQELQSIRDLLTRPRRRAPCREHPSKEEQ
jgi:DNA-binding transcriptional MerR regulator